MRLIHSFPRNLTPKGKLDELTKLHADSRWVLQLCRGSSARNYSTNRLALQIWPSKCTLWSCNVTFITTPLDVKSVILKSVTDGWTSLAALNQQAARMAAEVPSSVPCPMIAGVTDSLCHTTVLFIKFTLPAVWACCEQGESVTDISIIPACICLFPSKMEIKKYIYK